MKYFLITLILIAIILFSCFFVWDGVYLPKESGSTKSEIFLVKKGEGAKEISINLQADGLIKYKSLFRIYALITGRSGKLQAGEYELSPNMTIPEIVNKLFLGEVIKRKITIIEGWTTKDIGKYLGGNIPQELEGYLFPDTYEISYGDNIEDIIKKMRDNFDKKLSIETRDEIARQNKKISDIVIMASLIEKEVKTFEDKKIVSGILWKRLGIGMPLQVDATIIYIIGEEGAKISAEDKKINSPYNTYKYKGLPIGPICNPGLESMIAAVYPESSGYWYYLSTPEGDLHSNWREGETIFSRTLEEHNIAKAKYLK